MGVPFFPPSSAGGAGPAGPPGPAGSGLPSTNPVLVYVSPAGNDSNDGLLWNTAKKTIDGASGGLSVLAANGGGELHLAENCTGNIWLRGDGLSIPGWFPAGPIKIVGHGKSATQFGQPACGIAGGSFSGDRQTPIIWIAGSVSFPLTFENLMPAGGQVPQFLRLWDYNRLNTTNFPIAWANITSWTRTRGTITTVTSASRTGNLTTITFAPTSIVTGQMIHFESVSGSFASGTYLVSRTNGQRNNATTSTVCTTATYAETGADVGATSNPGDWSTGAAVLAVSLPPGLNITSAARTSNVTTLSFASTAPLPVPAHVGQHISVTSTSGSFSSGDKVVTGVTPTTLTYTEVAGNVGATANIGNWASHFVQASDYIDVKQTATSEICQTVYRVTATTATTITVYDPYGMSPGRLLTTVVTPTVGNVQYVLQDRSGYASGLLTFINLQAAPSGNASIDSYTPGPTFDLGGTSDGRIQFTDCAPSGYLPTAGCYDLDRMPWLLMDGGVVGSPGCSMERIRPNATGIRLHGSNVASCGINARDVGGDVAIGAVTVPAIDVVNGGAVSLVCHSVQTFDATGDVPSIRSDGGVAYCYVDGQCGHVDVLGYITSSQSWPITSKSAYVTGQVGFWAANRVSADTPHARRGGAPLTSQYQNMIQPSTTGWSLFALTAAAVRDPYGGQNAVRISGSGSVIPFFTGTNPHTGAAWSHVKDDAWLYGMWARKSGGLAGALMGIDMQGNNGFNGTLVSGFNGDGEWQWYSGYSRVGTVNVANSAPRLSIPVTSSVDIYGLTLIQVPIADGATDNEIAEMSVTMQSLPYYLPPTMAGTQYNQPFIGHGGLGSAKHYTVGVGVGKVELLGANGQVKEFFDESGASLGVLPLQDYAPAVTLPDSTNIVLWLRGDTVSGADGDAVGTWLDWSGNTNNATQATGGLKPLLKTGNNGINGKRVVRFDGVDDQMAGSFAPGSTGMSVYMVARTGASTTANATILSSGGAIGTAGIDWFFGLGTGGSAGAGAAGATENVGLGAVSGIATNTTFYGRWKTNKVAWAIDGVNSGTPADTSFPAGTFNYLVGNNGGGTTLFKGDIAEIIVYKTTTSSGDDLTIKTYLKTKYGIP